MGIFTEITVSKKQWPIPNYPYFEKWYMADFSCITGPLKDCNAISKSLSSLITRERGMKKVGSIYQGKTECNKNNWWFLKLLIFWKVILFPISNLELSLWQNNIKLHRVLCLYQINHIDAFGKYQRSKRPPLCSSVVLIVNILCGLLTKK